MRSHMKDVALRRHRLGTLFHTGRLAGSQHQVALAQIGEGNTAAATFTERASNMFQPEALFFVGVAGRLKEDIALGDIVVPPEVLAYHGGKDTDTQFHSRPRGWPVSHDLEQIAKLVDGDGSWLPRAHRHTQPRPQIHFKPIAAGEVVLDSTTSALARRLREQYNNAVAIEMEGAGVAQAAHVNQLPLLIIRGISDPADGTKGEADQAGWQEKAAANAAAFAVAVIRQTPVARRPQGNTEETPPRAEILMPAVAPGPKAPHAGWVPGAKVYVGDAEYLLQEPYLSQTHSGDRTTSYREARALMLRPTRGERPIVWIRQTEVHRPDAARSRALAVQRDLLSRLIGKGFPRQVQFLTAGDTTTLVVEWPRSRRTEGPCDTLATLPAATVPIWIAPSCSTWSRAWRDCARPLRSFIATTSPTGSSLPRFSSCARPAHHCCVISGSSGTRLPLGRARPTTWLRSSGLVAGVAVAPPRTSTNSPPSPTISPLGDGRIPSRLSPWRLWRPRSPTTLPRCWMPHWPPTRGTGQTSTTWGAACAQPVTSCPEEPECASSLSFCPGPSTWYRSEIRRSCISRSATTRGWCPHPYTR